MTLYLILFSVFVITALYRLERRINQMREDCEAIFSEMKRKRSEAK